MLTKMADTRAKEFVMSVNRIANLLKQVAATEGTASTGQGFTVNPFAPAGPCWQMQIYQAAFLQAQKAVEDEMNEWPLAEWWN
jgi:hypothetical protein